MKIKVGTIRSSMDGFNSIARIAKETRNMSQGSVGLYFSGCSFFEANMAQAQPVLDPPAPQFVIIMFFGGV